MTLPTHAGKQARKVLDHIRGIPGTQRWVPLSSWEGASGVSSGAFPCQLVCVSAAKKTPIPEAPGPWSLRYLRKVLRQLKKMEQVRQ